MNKIQCTFLLKNQNFGEKSQKVFPEGYVFINALYGLSWCEVIKNKDSNSFICEVRFRLSQQASSTNIVTIAAIKE